MYSAQNDKKIAAWGSGGWRLSSSRQQQPDQQQQQKQTNGQNERELPVHDDDDHHYDVEHAADKDGSIPQATNANASHDESSSSFTSFSRFLAASNGNSSTTFNVAQAQAALYDDDDKDDANDDHNQNEEVDPLRKDEYLKLKHIGYWFPQQQEEEETTTLLLPNHKQQQVEEEEVSHSHEANFSTENDHNDDDDEIAPLRKEEYLKLKQIGHWFPQSSSYYDDDDDSNNNYDVNDSDCDDNDPQMMIRQQALLNNIAMHNNNIINKRNAEPSYKSCDHHDTVVLPSRSPNRRVLRSNSSNNTPRVRTNTKANYYVDEDDDDNNNRDCVVDNDDDDDDDDNGDTIRSCINIESSDDGDDNNSDDESYSQDERENHNSSDDESFEALKTKKSVVSSCNVSKRRKATSCNKNYDTAVSSPKRCPKPSSRRSQRVLRSSNKKRKQDDLLVSSKRASAKKKTKVKFDDNSSKDDYDNVDSVGTSTSDDSSSDEGDDDHDENYSSEEEEINDDDDDNDSIDDDDDDESYEEEEASVVPKRRRRAAVIKTTKQQQPQKHRRISRKQQPTNTTIWNQCLLELKQYHEEHDTWEVDEKINNSLSKWTQKLRRRYLNRIQHEKQQEQQQSCMGNNDDNKQILNGDKTTKTKKKRSEIMLSDEQYQQLCDIGYEYTCHHREVEEQIWNERYDEVYEHYQLHQNWMPQNNELKRWIRKQKQVYRNKLANNEHYKLRDDRYIKLLHIGFPFPKKQINQRISSHFETIWNNHFNALVEYHKQYGTWDVNPKHNIDLMEWERRLRVQCRHRIRSQTIPNYKCLRQRNILTDERYEKLRSVGYDFPSVVGIAPDGQRLNGRQVKTWEERLEELKEYYEEHGTWNVKESVNKDLFSWERTLRQQYRNRVRMQHKQQEADNESNNNHTSQTSRVEDEEQKALVSSFASTANRNNSNQKFKKSRQKRFPVLSDERYELLCQIGYEFPFVREVPLKSKELKEEIFDSYIELYVEYKSKYDFLPSKCYRKFNPVTTKWCVDRHVENGKYNKLAKWMNKQRKAYMNRIDQQNQRGLFCSTKEPPNKQKINPPPLSDERYQKLLNVDFIFPDLHFMKYFDNNNNNDNDNDKHPDEESDES